MFSIFFSCMFAVLVALFPAEAAVHSKGMLINKNDTIENIPFKQFNGIQKNCFFLHGTGQTPESDPTTTFNEYWGNIDLYTPQCKKHIFLHEETIYRNFMDSHVLNRICNVITQGSVNGIISDAIIFTHSYGINLLGFALHYNYCELDTKTSKWYASTPSTLGSKTVEEPKDLCNNQVHGIDKALMWLLEELKYCNTTTLTINPSYASLLNTNPYVKEILPTIRKYVSGVMCGTDAFGITSKYSIPLAALARYTKFPHKNDGMLDIENCKAASPTSIFANTPLSPHYITPINHADSTCRVGDDITSSTSEQTRMPCAWFAYRY